MTEKRVLEAAARIYRLNNNCPDLGYGHPYERQYFSGGYYLNRDLLEEDRKILSDWASLKLMVV